MRQVHPVRVDERAALLDDEHFGAGAQDRVQWRGASASKRVPFPVERDGIGAAMCGRERKALSYTMRRGSS